MRLFEQLLIGSGMIGVTVMLHAIALDFIIRNAFLIEKRIKRATDFLWQPLMSAIIVISVFASHVFHIWLWAFLYTLLNAGPLQNFSEALYFSTVTYATLGYGDIVLGTGFRMLSGVEAANGFIMFGWSTAFIFEIISQLYRRETTKF